MRRLKQFANKLDDISRRDFVRSTAKACLGVSVASGSSIWSREAQAATGGKANHVIYLFMAGGMSHVDTFDPKPGTRSEGPIKTIKTRAAGIRLGEHLPNLAKHANKLAIVNSLHSREGSHERGTYLMHTNYKPLGTVKHAGMGAWAWKLGGRHNQNLPGFITVHGGGPGAGYLGNKFEPLHIRSATRGIQNLAYPKGIDRERFDRRLQLANQLDHDFQAKFEHNLVDTYTQYYDEAIRLMRSEDVKAFDISHEQDAVKQAYGNHSFGQGTLLARRLVEHGVRFVEVRLGGWDTHDNNFEKVEQLSRVLDNTVSTLLNDLEVKGLLDSTLVVIASEFGRTPKINGRQGRDHHPRAFSGVFAGGGIRGGQVYGKSDSLGHNVDLDGVTIQDFNATIGHAMGVDVNKEVYSREGRPFTLANHGKPITKLFG